MKWICVTSSFKSFTEGKIYDIISQEGSILELIDDNGRCRKTSVSGYHGPKCFVNYFMPLSKWRQQQLDKLDNFL
ncbi:hypothetical protein EBU71_19690 [bacterium]|jgi:hypothetical protein|nr:hypothetical protein [Candidatus Elulimicrobium humile]